MTVSGPHGMAYLTAAQAGRRSLQKHQGQHLYCLLHTMSLFKHTKYTRRVEEPA
jgi:hypothetical protein